MRSWYWHLSLLTSDSQMYTVVLGLIVTTIVFELTCGQGNLEAVVAVAYLAPSTVPDEIKLGL